MEVAIQRIEEHPVAGKPLGRHIQHDPRSRDFPVRAAVDATLSEVHHLRHGKIFDQGSVGSCTGNATAGAINTDPIHKKRHRLLSESDAVAIYSMATTLDGSPGSYPPDDTGSSGLAAAKAAQKKGYISAYHHAFDIQQAMAALQLSPLIIGVNWYEGFDHPDHATGLVALSGRVRGGHEIEVLGFAPRSTFPEGILFLDNSWGSGWGLNGGFTMTVATLTQLMSEQGDVTVLIP